MRTPVAAPLEPARPGPDAAGDPGRPRGDRPDLRWILARERTLLSWLRLSLVLFVLGLAPVALVPPGVARVPVTVVGAAFMLGCMAAAVVGVRRWQAAARSPGDAAGEP